MKVSRRLTRSRSTFELGLTKKKKRRGDVFTVQCFWYKAFSPTWSAAMQIGIKESFCLRKKFNCHRIGLANQHGRRFIVLVHKHGGRDVTRKQSNCSNF